jgi:hypothetical protein
VEHRVGAAQRLGDGRVAVEQVRLQRRHAGAVRDRATVDGDDRDPVRDQRRDQRPAEKPGRAGHDN